MQLDSVERPCEIVISGVSGEGIMPEVPPHEAVLGVTAEAVTATVLYTKSQERGGSKFAE